MKCAALQSPLAWSPLRVELGLILETLIADLVEGIRGVGGQLAQEHLLVGVEGGVGVDDGRCCWR
jgi:hypothetical protein